MMRDWKEEKRKTGRNYPTVRTNRNKRATSKRNIQFQLAIPIKSLFHMPSNQNLTGFIYIVVE